MKKGQGISINVVVIAAIALLVLVILSVLVIRAGTSANKSNECQTTGGTCIQQNPGDTCQSVQGDGWSSDLTKGCEPIGGVNAICCRKI